MRDPALLWADAQRTLRAAVADDGPPRGVPFAYLIFSRRGPHGGLGAGAALALIWNIPWLLRGAEEGAFMALYRPAPPADSERPVLVLPIAHEGTAHLPRAGYANVFGDAKPYGALGVQVGAEIVWPRYLPRQGRRSDPRWTPPDSHRAGRTGP